MNVNLFIWGIRKGFMPKGIYNSYSDNPSGLDAVPGDIRAVDLIQFDAFRPAFITRTAGTSSFMIHRTEQHTIVSYIYTNIKEFATGDRDGYVVFSLIIPKNYSFAISPRDLLHKLALFYKGRAEKSAQNNFVKEEIDTFLASVTLKTNNIVRIEGKHFYNFQNAQELDSILKCDLPYFSFEELILIDKSIDFATLDLEKKLLAKPEIQTCSFQKAIYATRKQEFENEQIKKKQDAEREALLRAEAEKVSSGISSSIRNGNKEQALKEYEQFPHKHLLDAQIKREIAEIKAEKEKEKRLAQTKERDLELSQEVINRWDRGDNKGALKFYEGLTDKTLLSNEYREKIYQYKNKIDREESKKRRLTKFILVLSVVLIATFVLVYVFVLNVDSNVQSGEQASGQVDSENNEKDNSELNSSKTKLDSLINGEQVFTGTVQNNSKLDSTFVKYSEKDGWEYLSKDSNEWIKVDKSVSIETLNKMFPGVMKPIEKPVETAVEPIVDPSTQVTEPPLKASGEPCDDFDKCKLLQDKLIANIEQPEDKSSYTKYMTRYITLKAANCDKVDKTGFKMSHNDIKKKYANDK